jgi:hypothetical protein
MTDVEAHASTYDSVVEEVITELLVVSGADKVTGSDFMANLYQLGGEIHRHVVIPYSNEFITLTVGGVITHVGHVFFLDDGIAHVIATADEMKEAQQDGTK